MTLYHTGDVQFFLPHELQDRSILAFAVPSSEDPNGAGSFSFVVTRHVTTRPTTPEAHADQVLDELPRVLTDYRLVERSGLTMDGRPAERVEFAWTSNGEPMQQQQTFVPTQDGILTLTATATEVLFEDNRPLLQRLLLGFKFLR